MPVCNLLCSVAAAAASSCALAWEPNYHVPLLSAGELKHLEKKKRSAVERGDYVAASHLQKEIDDVEFALMHLQYDVSRAWGQSDQLVNISVSLRKKQVSSKMPKVSSM